MKQIDESLEKAIKVLRTAELNADEGMPEELFLTISALVPLPNVDLFVTDAAGRILLSRRNDAFFENSWHIPGGCMRYGESFEKTIQNTAMRELGCAVDFDAEPMAVRNVLRGENHGAKHPRERGHNVAILFRCKLPKSYQICNDNRTEKEDGYLKWFDKLPSDFMQIQLVYNDILKPWMT